MDPGDHRGQIIDPRSLRLMAGPGVSGWNSGDDEDLHQEDMIAAKTSSPLVHLSLLGNGEYSAGADVGLITTRGGGMT